MIKLQAAKREQDYLIAENQKLTKENQSLTGKHLVGIDQLTPRPKITQMVEENKAKLDLPKDFDSRNTEAKVVWIVDKLHEVMKLKIVKKKALLKRNSSLMASGADLKLPSFEQIEASNKSSQQLPKAERSEHQEFKLQINLEDQAQYIKLKSLKKKFNDKAPEMD